MRVQVVVAVGIVLAAGIHLPVGAQPPVQPTGAQPRWTVGTHEGVPWPIDPPPVDHVPPAPTFSGQRRTAATEGGEKILALLDRVTARTTRTKYQHRTVVRAQQGVFLWDCSGMVAWILARATPRARRQLYAERPVARTFARAIERAPTDRFAGRWRRIDRIEEARPGDLFAWKRPRGFPSRNTGHVGFVMRQPRPVEGMPQAFAVRILDATSLPHQDDTRVRGGDGGTGEGTIVFLVDDAGRGTHYGWHGTRSPGYIRTPIWIGRIER